MYWSLLDAAPASEHSRAVVNARDTMAAGGKLAIHAVNTEVDAAPRWVPATSQPAVLDPGSAAPYVTI